MTKQDKKTFAFLLAKLETAFFESISKERVALYFDYLNDLSIGQIERAIDFLIERRERRGFPTIAEIRSATLGSMEYRAVEAWGEIMNKKFHFEKQFNDSLIPRVLKVAFGSLGGFYESDERNEMADRAHFLKTYKLIANLDEASRERRGLNQGKIEKRLEGKEL